MKFKEAREYLRDNPSGLKCKVAVYINENTLLNSFPINVNEICEYDDYDIYTFEIGVIDKEFCHQFGVVYEGKNRDQ